MSDSDSTQTDPAESSSGAAAETGEHRPRRGALFLSALLALALLAAGAGAWWWLARSGEQTEEAAGPPQPPLVRVARAERADTVAIVQTGFVRPVFEVDVTPEISARIAALGEGFSVGARETRGETLVSLERDRPEAALAEAEAQVERARAAVTEARIARDRQSRLEEEDFASEARLQDAILGVAQAEAQLAAARAAETRARRRLEDATIAAPFDALVTARTAAVGQAVAPGSVLGALVATGAAEVRMGLTPRDEALLGGAEVARGTAVELRATGPAEGRALGEGTVIATDPRIGEGSRTTGLIVRIEDAFAERDPRPLRVDELVELRLPVSLEGTGALLLPAEALKAGGAVFRVDPGDGEGPARLARVSVRVVYRSGGMAVVGADALSDGDRVMLSDRAGALGGQRVRIAPTGGAGPAGPGATESDAAGSDAAGSGAAGQTTSGQTTAGRTTAGQTTAGQTTADHGAAEARPATEREGASNEAGTEGTAGPDASPDSNGPDANGPDNAGG